MEQFIRTRCQLGRSGHDQSGPLLPLTPYTPNKISLRLQSGRPSLKKKKVRGVTGPRGTGVLLFRNSKNSSPHCGSTLAQ